MTPTPPSERYAECFAQEFAKHWGLKVVPLRNHLISQLKRMLGAHGVPPGAPLDDLALALVGLVAGAKAKAAVESLLTRPALEFRDGMLRPLLRDLFDWLRARLSYRLGAACHACRDDAVSQALKALVDHWKPWWATPEGHDHLQRYAFLTALRMALRMMKAEKRRERGLEGFEPGRVADPETQTIEAMEQRQRAIAQAKLRDLDWLLDAGLTPAEANAVVRWLGPSPTAGLDRRAMEALRKAFHRGRERLRTLADRLADDRRHHPRSPAHCSCTVEHLGLRGRFQVVDYAAGGLGLESAVDGAALELGADCTVSIHVGSTVIVRGARCIRIEQSDDRVRIGLQFHFPHPLPPLLRRPCESAQLRV